MHDIILPTFGLEIHTALMFYVIGLLIIFSLSLKNKLTIVPGKMQLIVELVIDSFIDLGDEVMGPKGKKFLPMILTFFLFILVSNILAMIPGLAPPTANINTTAGLAIIIFTFTHIVGIKEHGFGYIKQFLGPKWWLIPIMLPVEIVSHLVRPVSLSMRLFGNMFGHEVLVAALLGIMPLAYPLYLFSSVLGIMVIVIQAFIFSVLSMAYLGGALEEAH